MESLLDAADALLAKHPEQPPRPDFALPETLDASKPAPHQHLMECREAGPTKGRGWFARQAIPAGTVLLVDKALAMVMDWQDSVGEGNDNDDDEEEEPEGSILNELLLVQLLKRIKQEPSLWTNVLSDLFPRDNATAASLPVWLCHDDSIFIQVEELLQEIGKVPGLRVKDISKRLPLVIRYNALSVETCPELLVYAGPDGHAALSGTGLYHLPSYFNHSAKPNVSRWAVGDIMWFVANQDIATGEELCISYLEHDVLCENHNRRTLMMNMDFKEGPDHEEDDTDMLADDQDDGPEFPVVDTDVQNELMSMDPFQRLKAIQELMDQATGSFVLSQEGQRIDESGDTNMESENGGAWFQCDVHNLSIIRAITLDGLGQPTEALKSWEECIVFTETKLPPHDECSVVMRVQAALCALRAGNSEAANRHAAYALKCHNLLFGGGLSRFRRRYRREFKLALRPETGGVSGVDILWPQH